jgi:hypothetical protein
MNPTVDPPQLLPGVSASVWQTVLRVATGLAAVVIIPLVVVQALNPMNTSSLPPWIWPAIAGLAIVYLCRLATSLRTKKEAAAGYTTLWKAQPTLPQLDRSTGAVIREAGQPYVSKGDWQSGTGSVNTSVLPRLPEPTFLQRFLPSLPMWITSIVGLLVLNIFGKWIALGFLGFLVIADVLVVIATSIRMRRVRSVAPGDFVFLFTVSKHFLPAATSLSWSGETDAAFIPRAVSANAEGLTFWQGSPFQLVASLQWPHIISIQVDRVSTGNTKQPAVLVSFTDAAGAIQSLPLAGAHTHLAPFRTMPEVRWIASELEKLRIGETSARLI